MDGTSVTYIIKHFKCGVYNIIENFRQMLEAILINRIKEISFIRFILTFAMSFWLYEKVSQLQSYLVIYSDDFIYLLTPVSQRCTNVGLTEPNNFNLDIWATGAFLTLVLSWQTGGILPKVWVALLL